MPRIDNQLRIHLFLSGARIEGGGITRLTFIKSTVKQLEYQDATRQVREAGPHIGIIECPLAGTEFDEFRTVDWYVRVPSMSPKSGLP